MGIFSSLFSDDLTSSSLSSICDDSFAINPANGMPMVGGECGIDIEGNPFGTDFSHNDAFSCSSIDSFDCFNEI